MTVESGWSEHLCEHDRDDNDIEMVERDDPLLPPHMKIRECPQCGMWAEYDIETETHRIE